MSILTRDQLPPENNPYQYQVGFLLWEREIKKGPPSEWYLKPFIWWRNVDRKGFLRRYYDTGFVSMISHPEDVLAVFHAGDVQRFGRKHFRALKA
jgi:hypothetical protein